MKEFDIQNGLVVVNGNFNNYKEIVLVNHQLNWMTNY